MDNLNIQIWPKKATNPRKTSVWEKKRREEKDKHRGGLEHKGRCDKVLARQWWRAALRLIRLKTAPLTRPNGPNTTGLAKTQTIIPDQTNITWKYGSSQTHNQKLGRKKIPLLYEKDPPGLQMHSKLQGKKFPMLWPLNPPKHICSFYNTRFPC